MSFRKNRWKNRLILVCFLQMSLNFGYYCLMMALQKECSCLADFWQAMFFAVLEQALFAVFEAAMIVALPVASEVVCSEVWPAEKVAFAAYPE